MGEERLRQIALGLTVLVVVVGLVFSYHDTLLLACLITAGGLILSRRDWRAWSIAAVFVVGGLFWSSLDGSNCSAWWKGRIVAAKLTGNLSYLSWGSLGHGLVSPCYSPENPNSAKVESVELVQEKLMAGQKCELYRSSAGDFWLPAPGKELLKFLIWEMMEQSDYESSEVTIRPGDTVIDAGAHVGVYTRFALNRGAARVVAIEPDPVNYACLEANLAEEIAGGKVRLVKAGVWDEKGTLTLSVSHVNSADSSFIIDKTGAEHIDGVPVLPLDDIVDELQLDRVDFIKMDIEGSERQALKGASRTLRQFKPRMAICAYHQPGDPAMVSSIAREAHPDYQILAKDVNFGETGVAPKVLFFN
jgi:FkbM family methyltransferase